MFTKMFSLKQMYLKLRNKDFFFFTHPVLWGLIKCTRLCLCTDVSEQLHHDRDISNHMGSKKKTTMTLRIVTKPVHAHRTRKYCGLEDLFWCHNSKLNRCVFTPYLESLIWKLIEINIFQPCLILCRSSRSGSSTRERNANPWRSCYDEEQFKMICHKAV